MPSQSRRRRRRQRQLSTAKPQPPTVATVHSLGDDLLREIFLRLPSLPSLVRAALTCRAFLAVIRPSTFRRRFCALHPPPLLGFFFESIGTDVPSFSPIRRRSDPDIAAAVRGADVFLTRIPYYKDASPGWNIRECRGGCLLLVSCSTQQIAVYNPLTRALDLFPTPPYGDISSGYRGKFCYMNYFLLCSDQSPSSFRVVSSCHDESRVRASVFSSDTREWQILPWSGTAPAQPSGNNHWLMAGTQVNGKLYWPHDEQAYMVVLDTSTLQLSCINLLEFLKGQGYLYELGGTKDGKLCIVSVARFTLYIWFRRADASGAEEWMLHNVIPLEGEILQAAEIQGDELYGHMLKAFAVLDGIVYMSIDGEHTSPSWFLSFCLETRKLEKLFQRTFDNCVYPYIMGWPPFLMGNDIDTALDSGV
ncbi:uncharacterized protein [Miscanthus floridulus]|uniref:uncharacterized protein n=1 Tax=Miscanthus floridulus TaxID=154761 RepID=UPI003459DED6